MELEITERSQELLELLMEIPPRFDVAKTYLEVNQLSADEVTRVANVYIYACFLDFGDHLLFKLNPGCNLSKLDIPTHILSELHSAYIYDIVKFLLPYGLDPNAVYSVPFGHYNIMDLLFHIDHGYLAADTMALLLENGGDPNLIVDTETVFEGVDEDIWFGAIEQEIRWRYDQWVHLWMVLLAYGGKIPGQTVPTEFFREYNSQDLFDIQKLKNHRDYYYGITRGDHGPIIHIFDKKTMWEVVRV